MLVVPVLTEFWSFILFDRVSQAFFTCDGIDAKRLDLGLGDAGLHQLLLGLEDGA